MGKSIFSLGKEVIIAQVGIEPIRRMFGFPVAEEDLRSTYLYVPIKYVEFTVD